MVYLDNHATTPLDERVRQAMAEVDAGAAFGNPASTHQVGVAAHRALESARQTVATLLPGRKRRVVFTSGATEANAIALFGWAPKGRRRGVVLSALEHPSVSRCAEELTRRGCAVAVAPTDRDGVIDVEALLDLVDDSTALVALMLVNNEVGTVQPVAAVARRVRASFPACRVHVDAAQAIGLVDLSPLEVATSYSISAHKVHGPKGAGALIFEPDRPPRPLWFGGGQEGGVRSGTPNVAGAVGLAEAVRLATTGWEQRAARIGLLRDRLVSSILAAVPDAYLVGHPRRRTPANAMIAVPGLTSDVLVGALDQRGVVASTGSACHSTDPTPSEVLRAMGHDERAGTVRFGLSRLTTEQDIDAAIEATADAVARLRKGRR